MNKLFSERYGYKKLGILKMDEMPDTLRTRIWNVFYQSVFPQSKIVNGFVVPLEWSFIEIVWDKFFHKDISLLEEYSCGTTIENINKLFLKLAWYEVYDFIEFFPKNFPRKKEKTEFIREVLVDINKVLEEEKAAYRILEEKVSPITSEEEIREIEQALNQPDKFKNTTDHLQNALNLLSNREKPDYANSIKESISVLESMVQILLGKKGTLGNLINELNIHQALKTGFGNLYGWTSDEGGIRHAKFGEPFEVGFVEAKYMLVTVSAFINYLKEKLAK